jgi:HPt (histidine-containing phosphotransfer) domain-containing protein
MALDKTPAMEALEVSEPELDELLREFVELAEAELDSIRSGLEGKRLVGMDRWAHSIRGMAANLRLELCRTRAARLETALVGRDATLSEEAIGYLEQAIDEVRKAAKGG